MSVQRNKRGQAAILFTIAATVTFGALGLAVDIGWAYFRKQAAQAAADAAALAAVQSALQNSPGSFSCASSSVACQSPTPCPTTIPNPPSNNIHSGCLYAKDNGFQV